MMGARHVTGACNLINRSAILSVLRTSGLLLDALQAPQDLIQKSKEKCGKVVWKIKRVDDLAGWGCREGSDSA